MVVKENANFTRKIITAILLVVMAVTIAVPVSAASSKVNTRIRELIYYYQYYQEEAETDIARLIDEITELDPEQGDKWQRIIDFWSWMNREMEKVPDCLPDGLPDDDSLCIVVLGYGLEYNGDMKPELFGRMETALNCAKKYPNAYILCTGGGTAAGNRAITEAGQMSQWLLDKGIDKSRIIVEDDSWSTALNARYSCRLLKKSYPQIRSLAIVTSDYHVRRGCLVFNTESVLTDADLEIVGNAIYVTNRGITETITYQGFEISQLVYVGYQNDAAPPTLSQLKRLTVEGETVYEMGQELQISVSAYYDTDYTRDVTADSLCSGIDFNKPGKQTLTVSYTENGKTCTTEFEIELLIPETEPAPTQTVPQTEPVPTEPIPENTTPAPTGVRDLDFSLFPVLAAPAAVMILLVLCAKSRKGKYRK